MSDQHEKSEALKIKEQAQERRAEELAELKDGTDRGVEEGAAGMPPHRNQTPGEEHRGGPLPNMKR